MGDITESARLLLTREIEFRRKDKDFYSVESANFLAAYFLVEISDSLNQISSTLQGIEMNTRPKP